MRLYPITLGKYRRLSNGYNEEFCQTSTEATKATVDVEVLFVYIMVGLHVTVMYIANVSSIQSSIFQTEGSPPIAVT